MVVKVHIGFFDSPENAFKCYKEYKENLIKTVAKDYYNIGSISREVYNTLMEWEVVPYPE